MSIIEDEANQRMTPRLCLLSFHPGEAEIWTDASTAVAGVKMFSALAVQRRLRSATAGTPEA